MFLNLLRSLGLMKPKKMSFDVSPEAMAEFEKKMKDPGIFTFDEKGFTVALDNGPLSIRWEEIDRLVGYKKDQYATDLICLDVEYRGMSFTIHEETAGWFVFLDRTKAAFPGIHKNWEAEIALPVFATNLTVLYVRS